MTKILTFFTNNDYFTNNDDHTIRTNNFEFSLIIHLYSMCENHPIFIYNKELKKAKMGGLDKNYKRMI